MSLPTPPATQDFLFGPSAARERPTPVFAGEQRAKAMTMLAAAISEQRVMAVLQLVNKDPSLAFETLQMPICAGAAQVAPVEFPLACLQHGIAAGYTFAVGHGFPVDAPMANGSTTLLQAALALSGSRNCEADVSLLLGMGADCRNMRSPDSLYGVVAAAFPAKSDRHAPGAVSMLLDAKVDFAYAPSYMCPYSVLLMTHGWNESEIAVALTRVMARFVKGGLSLERKTGSPAQTPMQRALGVKNGEALIVLIRLGAKSEPESLNGKDLFSLMSAQGLGEFKPGAQAALMEAHISQQARLHRPLQPAAGAEAQASVMAPSPRRRRLGTI